MNKTFAIVFALLLACVPTFAQLNDSFGKERYQKDNANLGPREAGVARVIFYGDSITDGWPGKSPDFFATPGFIGRGISGQTSYQFLLRFRNDVVELEPDIVVLNYGTNDIAENTGAYCEEQTFRNVKTMCDIAKANGIKVILASTLPHGGFGWNPKITDAMAKVRSLNAKVQEYASANGIPYVDWFSAMVSSDGSRMREDLSGDGVHPNPDGYAIMESLVLPVIRKEVPAGR